MSVPETGGELLAAYRKSGLYVESVFREAFETDDLVPEDARTAAAALVKADLLTGFQAKQLLAGKFRGFALGVYKILEPIGKGGMGVVFLGEHTSLKRKVAIKVLPAAKAQDKLSLERFYREARAVAALSHPNIVALHDISQGGGVHFLVMEYVPGTDLQSLMAKTGPLHYAQAVDYIAQAAAGLKHAHDKGFIHRDIKPANLILGKDGVIKILDLGLARSTVNAADDLTGLLGEGEVAGTVDYVSPEQAMCQPTDERADVYSLGVTLYALITGHPPFSGSTSQKLLQHQLKDAPSLSKKLAGKVPPALTEVVAKMMAKRPNDRYQSAEDVIDALGPWLPAPTTGSVVQDPLTQSNFVIAAGSRRGSASNSRAATGRKNRGPLIAAALVIAVLGGGGAAFVAAGGGSSPDPQVLSTPPMPPGDPATRPAAPPEPPAPVVPPPRPANRTPLAALPGDARFTPVNLSEHFNATTNRIINNPDIQDDMLLDDWSDRRIEGVPFRLVGPDDADFNILQMYSPNLGAATKPVTQTIPVNSPAAALHLLSGTGAWGFPCGDGGNIRGSEKNSLVLTVVIHFADGTSESHDLLSGVHFTDFCGRHNVPESKVAIRFKGPRNMNIRYLAIRPNSTAVIKELELIKNEDDGTSPLVMALTVEVPSGDAAARPAAARPAAARPGAPRGMIPLQLTADAVARPAAGFTVPTGSHTLDGVLFDVAADGGPVVLGTDRAAAFKVGCFLPAKAVHVLGAVGAGLHPDGPADAPAVTVRLHYAGGETETHEWRNGRELATAAKRQDVPGSAFGLTLPAGGQLRVVTVTPKKSAVIQFVEFVNLLAGTKPVVAAVTVESL